MVKVLSQNVKGFILSDHFHFFVLVYLFWHDCPSNIYTLLFPFCVCCRDVQTGLLEDHILVKALEWNIKGITLYSVSLQLYYKTVCLCNTISKDLF